GALWNGFGSAPQLEMARCGKNTAKEVFLGCRPPCAPNREMARCGLIPGKLRGFWPRPRVVARWGRSLYPFGKFGESSTADLRESDNWRREAVLKGGGFVAWTVPHTIGGYCGYAQICASTPPPFSTLWHFPPSPPPPIPPPPPPATVSW